MAQPPNGTLAYRVQRLEEDVQKLRDLTFRLLMAVIGALLTFVVAITVFVFTH